MDELPIAGSEADGTFPQDSFAVVVLLLLRAAKAMLHSRSFENDDEAAVAANEV
jgi:hypothetical protein